MFQWLAHLLDFNACDRKEHPSQPEPHVSNWLPKSKSFCIERTLFFLMYFLISFFSVNYLELLVVFKSTISEAGSPRCDFLSYYLEYIM